MLLALGVNASCSAVAVAGVDLPANARQIQQEPVELVREYYSGVGSRQRAVIRDGVTWAGFFSEVMRTRQPQPPVPGVDFGEDMVIAAAMGTRPSGGHAIRIDGVYESDGDLYVVVRQVSPGPGCLTTAALTAPVVAVRTPRHTGAVRFVEREETLTCM